MSRSSPAVRRVVSILNFFAEHPGHNFTLTDLVKALKLSRATCHALLTGLVEVGYLYRTSDKSYVLGPTLASIGRIASIHYSPLQIAQPEMRALADEYDGVCLAVFRDGNDVSIRERAAAVSHLGWTIHRGATLPLRPPFAGIFFAWSPPAEADAWVDRLDPPPTAQQRAQMGDCMTFAREYGFMLAIRNVVAQHDQSTNDWLFLDRPDTPVYVQNSIEPDREYPVSGLSAPVFEADGRIAFVLSLAGLVGRYSGKQVLAIGQQLCDACRRITAFTAPFTPAAS
jgi:DNA-binding IclR family transcriptional regulator